MTKAAAEAVCLEQVVTSHVPVKGFWSALATSVAQFRCRLIHRSISRPVHGKYRCWTCLREFEIEW